jgi:hypothetical protein
VTNPSLTEARFTEPKYIRQPSIIEQEIYDALVALVRKEEPQTMLDEFRHLFVEGSKVKYQKIYVNLSELVAAPDIQENFPFILNRCCHILINYWRSSPSNHWAILDLVDLFHDVRPPRSSASRTSRRIRQLVLAFNETPQYRTIERLSKVIAGDRESKKHKKENVGDLINRYPYLYNYCLLNTDSNYEERETVRKIQEEIQHKFELDISQFVTHQVRLVQLVRKTQSIEEAQKLLKKVENPTLLSDREVAVAIKNFVGKVNGRYTHRDISQHFLAQSLEVSTYGQFKEDLYHYLVSSIDPKFGQAQFNQKLYDIIQSTLPDFNDKKLDQFLILRTSSQLLNFLVVESPHQPNHYVFVDLITNLGPTSTTVLLLKLALLSNKVRPHLEKRFSILFNHYEASAEDGVPWLVKSLENLHIALSVHFGSADVSCIQQIM